MKLIAIVLGATVMFHAKAKAAPAEQIDQCPSELDGKLIQVHAVQKGWEGMAAFRLFLERASIVTGPPDALARAELRGDERRVGKSTSQTVYSGLGIESEKWLVCGYGQGADIEQAYRLPDSIKRCVIKVVQDRQRRRKAVSVSCE
ncbi:MAG: STY0301 family protein [Massilia sp.]